ncbi:MAG: hypothetical protein KDD10_29865 [Phaeodactylibacter sp.]|nr:hypothetical protein [Phaeodactylibacter sp.]MCB9297222.1 hypothetical protein [Lewinellaceae bacterium]
MTIQAQQLQVKHSRPDGRFYIAFDDHDDAVLDYEERKDNSHSVLDFKHALSARCFIKGSFSTLR